MSNSKLSTYGEPQVTKSEYTLLRKMVESGLCASLKEAAAYKRSLVEASLAMTYTHMRRTPFLDALKKHGRIIHGPHVI